MQDVDSRIDLQQRDEFAEQLKDRVLDIVEDKNWSTELGIKLIFKDLLGYVPEDEADEVMDELLNFT